MDERAFRVATIYLNKYSQTEDAPEEVRKPKPLDESQINEFVTDALETFYPTAINAFLRGLSMSDLLTVGGFIIRNFHPTDSDEKLLNQKLNNVKNNLLNAIKEVALSDEGSMKDTMMDHFKKSPVEDEEDVSDYIRSWLRGIVNNTEREIKKII